MESVAAVTGQQPKGELVFMEEGDEVPRVTLAIFVPELVNLRRRHSK
jgi:hypothetical protein